MKSNKVKIDIADHRWDVPMSHSLAKVRYTLSHSLANSCPPSEFFFGDLDASCVTYHDMQLLESEMRWVNGIALSPDDKSISICHRSHLQFKSLLVWCSLQGKIFKVLYFYFFTNVLYSFMRLSNAFKWRTNFCILMAIRRFVVLNYLKSSLSTGMTYSIQFIFVILILNCMGFFTLLKWKKLHNCSILFWIMCFTASVCSI